MRERYKPGDAKLRENLFDLQDGRCAICRKKFLLLDGMNREKFCLDIEIDHDHKTGLARSILCHRCNVGLGNFEDNPELLEKAATYIRFWR